MAPCCVCVCGGTCWISGKCVINVPVRDLNQLLAMYPSLLIYPALIKTDISREKGGV